MTNRSEVDDSLDVCGTCQLVDGRFLELDKKCAVHGKLAAFLADSASASLPDALVIQGRALASLHTFAATLHAQFEEAGRQLAEQFHGFQLPQCVGTPDVPLPRHWPGSAAGCPRCQLRRGATGG